MTNTNRQINAAIKREFGSHPSFAPAKSAMFGSFPSVRFEADLPMSLTSAVARFVQQTFPAFVEPFGSPTHSVLSFHFGGTVINWTS